MAQSISPQTMSRQAAFDDGPFPRGRIGFVCVANAGLTEGDMARMCPDGVGLSFTHMRMRKECTLANLAQMEHDIDDALSGFVPARDDMDVLCYNCTSGSFVIGEDIIRAKLEAGRPNVKGTTLMSGVVASLRALGIGKLSVGTAYTQDINELERIYLETQGFSVNAIEGLGLCTDLEMNRVSPGFLRDFAISLDRPDAEAIFLSCGALRSLEVVEAVEREIGKPVLCSNQASFWHCLRLTGINDRIEGFGRLFCS